MMQYVPAVLPVKGHTDICEYDALENQKIGTNTEVLAQVTKDKGSWT